MPVDSTLDRALEYLSDARTDLVQGGFRQRQEGFKRVVAVLDADPLATLIRSYLPEFDFDGWWLPGLNTSVSMSGGTQLAWPQRLEDRLAAQVAFCRRAAADPGIVQAYMYRVIGTGPGDLDERLESVVERTVDPLIRDLGRLASRRLVPPILDAALRATIASGDQELDRLLEEAQTKFRDRSPSVRKEGLERLWDAFERMKTLPDASDKKRSARQLLDLVAKQPSFRALLDSEALELTRIGNDYHIRHFETSKDPINDPAHIDYLFHRCFAFVYLCLGAIRTTV